MTNFPNPAFPISDADCADIEAIFIELMRAREAEADTHEQVGSAKTPNLDPYGNEQDR
jgi:hypothetical protein